MRDLHAKYARNLCFFVGLAPKDTPIVRQPLGERANNYSEWCGAWHSFAFLSFPAGPLLLHVLACCLTHFFCSFRWLRVAVAVPSAGRVLPHCALGGHADPGVRAGPHRHCPRLRQGRGALPGPRAQLQLLGLRLQEQGGGGSVHRVRVGLEQRPGPRHVPLPRRPGGRLGSGVCARESPLPLCSLLPLFA